MFRRLLVLADLENMAPDHVGPDEDTGVTALSNCGGANMNTTVFVTVPASPFPARVSFLPTEYTLILCY